MWFSKPKEPAAEEKWHAKALMVDPRKTRITIIRATVPKKHKNKEKLGTEALNMEASVPNVIAVQPTRAAEEGLDAVDSTLGIGQNLITTKQLNLEIMKSTMTEMRDFDEPAENPETTEPNLGPMKPNAAEPPSKNETSGNPETFAPATHGRAHCCPLKMIKNFLPNARKMGYTFH